MMEKSGVAMATGEERGGGAVVKGALIEKGIVAETDREVTGMVNAKEENDLRNHRTPMLEEMMHTERKATIANQRRSGRRTIGAK
mmetsp:Transcript_45581/g.117835  ORF Transcript_45581/g.117835 Transcript_45581/m.117835 type:complete len:85 (+) Transcript_45581:114-368(+)